MSVAKTAKTRAAPRVRSEDPRVIRSRKLVLEAARSLVSQRGPAAFRIEALTEETGVALTTIYRHWPTRKDLLTDAIASLADVGPLPDTGSLRGDLLAFFTCRTHRMQQRDPWQRSLETLPGLLEAGRNDPQIAVVVDYTVRGLLSGLKLMLERGQARGQVRNDRHMDVMADILLGAVFIRRGYRGEETADDFLEEIVDTLMDALGVTNAATLREVV